MCQLSIHKDNTIDISNQETTIQSAGFHIGDLAKLGVVI